MKKFTILDSKRKEVATIEANYVIGRNDDGPSAALLSAFTKIWDRTNYDKSWRSKLSDKHFIIGIKRTKEGVIAFIVNMEYWDYFNHCIPWDKPIVSDAMNDDESVKRLLELS